MKLNRNTVFFILTAVLALLPFIGKAGGFAAFIGLGILCTVLAAVLIILTSRTVESKPRKVFFKLAGYAALGPAFGILHNLPFVQRLWHSVGASDEPFFFLLAALICPALFLISAAACIGMLVRDRFSSNNLQERHS